MKLQKYEGDHSTASLGQHVQRTRLDAEIKRFKQKRAIAHGEGDKGIQAHPMARAGRAVSGPTVGKHWGRTVGEQMDAGLINAEIDPAPYGLREDQTPKGEGYFGKIKRLDDPTIFSTELSASTDFNVNGQPVLFPLLVPTLSREEIDHLVSGKEPTPAITKKAETFARERMAKGLSPFAKTGEQGQLPDLAQQKFNQGFPESDAAQQQFQQGFQQVIGQTP